MKYTRPVVDADLRFQVFNEIRFDLANSTDEITVGVFHKVNDRQYGIILIDKNGVERYVRLGAIVAEEREDMTARELLAKEQAEYAEKQAKAQAKAEERARKAKADKARREAKEKEKGE